MLYITVVSREYQNLSQCTIENMIIVGILIKKPIAVYNKGHVCGQNYKNITYSTVTSFLCNRIICSKHRTSTSRD